MKEIADMNLPEDVRYAEDHEWVKKTGDIFRIGISDYAQDQLGDITFVDLPEVGESFAEGDEFGAIESTKAVSELYMPVGGEIAGVNQDLEDDPALLNQDPYGKGWLVEIKPEDEGSADRLMETAAYRKYLEGLE